MNIWQKFLWWLGAPQRETVRRSQQRLKNGEIDPR